MWKTKNIKEFAKKHFKYVNYINFWENSSYKDAFSTLNINFSLNSNDPKQNRAENIIEMKTMDFEEFLWTNNYNNEQINTLLTYFTNKEKILNLIHEKMKNLFK